MRVYVAKRVCFYSWLAAGDTIMPLASVHAPSQAQPLLAQALQRVYHRHLSHDESRDHIVKYYLLQ